MSIAHRLARAENEQLRLLAAQNRSRMTKLRIELREQLDREAATLSAAERAARSRANLEGIAAGFAQAVAEGNEHPWYDDPADYVGIEEELEFYEQMYREWLADPEAFIRGETTQRPSGAHRR